MVQQASRQERRARTRRNGTKPAGAVAPVVMEVSARLRVLGKSSGEVELGGKKVHLAKHTAAGIADVETWLQQAYPAIAFAPGDTIGQQLVSGCVMTRSWGALTTLVNKITTEELTVDEVAGSDIDELADVVDAFFGAPGLQWLRDMLGNWIKRVNEARAKYVEMTGTNLVSTVMDATMNPPEGVEGTTAGTTEPGSSPGGTDGSQDS